MNEAFSLCDVYYFCGCCGGDIDVDGDIEDWCRLCEEHVLSEGALWNRTFYAQWKRPCPYQPIEIDVD
jgi:hypothetical protein